MSRCPRAAWLHLFFWHAAITGCANTSPPVASPAPTAVVGGNATGPELAVQVTRSAMVHCPDGSRAVVVELNGIVAGSPAAIFATLRGFELCDPDVWTRDALAIQAYYYDHGHPQAQVTPARIQVTPDSASIRARFDIHEGPVFRVGHYAAYEVRGDDRAEPMGGFQPSLLPRDIFRRSDIARDLDQLLHAYRDAGYAAVVADPIVTLDETRREVDVIVPIRRGELHRFRRIQFAGLERAREEELWTRVGVSPGQLYSESALLQAKQALSASGLFSRVDVVTRLGDGPREIDVTFEVDELP